MRMNAFNTQEECRHKKSRRELEAKPVCVPHENPTRTGRQTRADGSDEDWLADDEDLKDCAGQMELGGRGGGGLIGGFGSGAFARKLFHGHWFPRR